ncbi:phage tail assembly chaperone [Megasphaera massiliensis]|uniref:phage tail assembly chaperone n=1 Tax=Megasphaera massiliensis TaxID=1232428 RepID=UPI000405308F|nr:hypothetical protein [Megasphaera massiliensis]DAF84460.1 MAG TPA: tail assembly chaperone protein [Caudoviricetes sp.]
MKLTELLLSTNPEQVTVLPSETFEVTRLSEAFGNAFVVNLQAIPSKRMTEIQQRNMSIDGDGRQDINLYDLQLSLLADGIVDKDFNNVEVLKKYGAATKKDLFEKLFLAGEIAAISEKINKLSGYDKEKNKKIAEEVKN